MDEYSEGEEPKSARNYFFFCFGEPMFVTAEWVKDFKE